MGESIDEEEVRDRNIQAMGEPLGQLFSALSNELTWQFLRWGQFEQLFGSKPSRVDLLNQSAPLFFNVVQDALWHDTVLGITRLVGPARTGVGKRAKQNLSIQQLPVLISDETLRVNLEALIQDSVQLAQFAFDWRNRFIAHRDLDVALNRHAMPLAPSTRFAVNAALDSVAKALNVVDFHYFNATKGYRDTFAYTGAESLLFVIRDGLKLQERRQSRVQSGEYDPDDWPNDPV